MVVLMLNDRWRITDDPPQWTLEQRVSEPSAKATGWKKRKFIIHRDHLLKRIDEMCGQVDREAIETIRSWPAGYVVWKYQTTAGPVEGCDSALRGRKVISDTPEQERAARRYFLEQVA